MIEQQLGSINREYELEKQQYNSLSERHQAAVLAEDLERRRAGEQFAVLYPAFLPSQPSSPGCAARAPAGDRSAGSSLPAGLTFAREYLDRSVYDAARAAARVRTAGAGRDSAHRDSLRRNGERDR